MCTVCMVLTNPLGTPLRPLLSDPGSSVYLSQHQPPPALIPFTCPLLQAGGGATTASQILRELAAAYTFQV
ncbi:hypothetical protein SKAU_G00229080 [Synaphobranchus kaupii]|uniref:Uncharacterized protein n=1 Tax=Synaphobranchus kaupii TaxID=118154 RepID=A0A9Q1IST4_SYNKA|nr:hypothetical protein SKAU_G00229080 [Synaphobranchus kaupii]